MWMQTAATPEHAKKHSLARLIKDDLVDLVCRECLCESVHALDFANIDVTSCGQDRRLMAAPYEIGAQVPSSATCFTLQQLRSEGEHGAVSQQLCEEMRENHFVIVRLDDAGESALQGVWTAARRFFDLSGEQKEEVAG